MFKIVYKVLSDFELSVEEYKQVYELCKAEFLKERDFDFSKLDILFEIAVYNLDLFIKINLPANEKTTSNYLKKWITSYINEINNLPSVRHTKKSTTPKDDGLKKMVQTALELEEEEAGKAEQYHTVFMNAENIQGSLLEEYIDSKVGNQGWIWCAGNIFRAVDFCKLDTETGQALFLQIKTKYNTENSSSSAIRKGTKINKWNRIDKKKDRDGNTIYNWNELNEIMGTEKDNEFSEEDYQKFLEKIIEQNPKIIYNDR